MPIVLLIWIAIVPQAARAQPPPVPAAQDEFVPIDALPPEDQLPAAPLLIGAYAFVWVTLLAYVWSLWRRLGKVEREMASLARRIERSSGSGRL